MATARAGPEPVWGTDLVPPAVVPARVAEPRAGRGSRADLALLPPAAALAAILLAWATGFSRRDALPPALDALTYGFFVDRYPLYAAAIVYGLAHLAVAAVAPGPASPLRRAIGAGLGMLALLALSLYPTFGGVILRVGFMTGGVAFLQQMPMTAAYALGAAASALVYGGTIGLAVLLARGRWRPPEGRGRALLRLAGWAAAGFLALWLGAVVLGLARDLGVGPWPRRTLRPDEAFRAAAVLVGAALPHVLLRLARTRRDRFPG